MHMYRVLGWRSFFQVKVTAMGLLILAPLPQVKTVCHLSRTFSYEVMSKSFSLTILYVMHAVYA